jgi:hypothetical protein
MEFRPIFNSVAAAAAMRGNVAMAVTCSMVVNCQ